MNAPPTKKITESVRSPRIGILSKEKYFRKMFTLLMGLLGAGSTGLGFKKSDKILFSQNKQQFDQTLLFTDLQEKSFSTQLQTTVRMPFGPNPQQRFINDMSLLKSPRYQESYQRNIWNNQIGTEDWRIDSKFNSSLNQYASMHMPESTPEQISNYHFKRRMERTDV